MKNNKLTEKLTLSLVILCKLYNQKAVYENQPSIKPVDIESEVSKQSYGSQVGYIDNT